MTTAIRDQALVGANTRGATEARSTTSRRKLASSPRYFELNGAIMVAIAAVALTIIGILYLVQTSHVAQLGYESSRLQSERYEIGLEVAALKSEVARYQSLDTVERVASQQLGMETNTEYRFLNVSAPVETELPAPEAAEVPHQPLVERIMAALLGTGSAHSDEISTATTH